MDLSTLRSTRDLIRTAGKSRDLLFPVRASQLQNCSRTLRPCLPRDSLSVSLFHGSVTVSSCVATLPDLARSAGEADRSTHHIRSVTQAIRFRARWCSSLVFGCEELLGRAANPFPRRCYAGNRSHFWKIWLRLPPLIVASSLLEILLSEQLAKQGRAYPKDLQASSRGTPPIPASGLNCWAKGDPPKHC